MATQSKTSDRRRAPRLKGQAALAPAPVAPASPYPPAPKGKLGAMINLLRRPEGAQVGELMAATGWQAHSVRGAISGALKKKLGLAVTSEKTEAGRIYRIVCAAAGVDA